MEVAENFVKKTLDFGLGLALFSKEKIEAMVEDMVNRGEVARKDARKLADDLVEKGVEGREEIRHLISDEVHKALSHLGLTNEDSRREEIARIVHEQVEAELAARETKEKPLD